MKLPMTVVLGPCLRFTNPLLPQKGNLPASGPWMPSFTSHLCGGRRQAEPSDGLYRYAIRQMLRGSNSRHGFWRPGSYR